MWFAQCDEFFFVERRRHIDVSGILFSDVLCKFITVKVRMKINKVKLFEKIKAHLL